MNQKHIYGLVLAGMITLVVVILRLSSCVSLPAVLINRTQPLHSPQPARQNASGEYDKRERIENIEKINLLGKTCSIRTSTDPEDVFTYMENITIRCNTPILAGRVIMEQVPYIKNEKYVCLDRKYKIVPGNCLIYSFGISTDWSFDDDMDQLFNCKVYCFDHTIHKRDHQRSKNIRFLATGISSVKRNQVDRYINILKRFGHENATIDYLKMDVEGAELQFFEDVFTNTPEVLNNIKQIGMEIHATRNKNYMKRYMRYFELLECLGFRLMFSQMIDINALLYKKNGKTRSCCYELMWARDKEW